MTNDRIKKQNAYIIIKDLKYNQIGQRRVGEKGVKAQRQTYIMCDTQPLLFVTLYEKKYRLVRQTLVCL